MKNKVFEWFANGERGISSEAMACAVCGIQPNERWAKFGNNPRDPDDFRRCVLFLEAVPEAREHLDSVAKLSEVWARLVDRWDDLEALLEKEMPTGKAPKLYNIMKDIGC